MELRGAQVQQEDKLPLSFCFFLVFIKAEFEIFVDRR